MHKPWDTRPLVLAYGAWGATSHPHFKGNPPSPQVGIMRKLAKRFLVVPTPEHFTSQRCVRCGERCAAHDTLKDKKNHAIRGLRVCQNEDCRLLQNRDRTGATNIGRQLHRLLRNTTWLQERSADEEELHQLKLRLECEECEE